ncbi:MAG: LacI family DNA-binding transcriptional regulator [Ignavibacteriaceae bacterium]
MPPTIKELALAAGVSIATVSRALNNDPKVTLKTKKLINKTAKEMNYKVNLLARSFVKKQSNILGLILPDIFDEFFTEIIRGVDEATYQRGYFTMVSSTHSNKTLVESTLNFINNGIVGGIILLLPNINKEIQELITSNETPVSVITSEIGLFNCDSVSIDNSSGAYEVVRYAYKEMGYQKLAFISGPVDNNDSETRRLSFLQACREFGVKKSNISFETGNFSRESGYKAFKKLMNKKDKPEFVFAANDMMAIGCYDLARELKLRIPGDIAIIGFDDILLSQFLNPPLTSVQVPTTDLGIKAANLVMDRMEDKSLPIRNIKIPVKLIHRNSC